MLADFVCAQVAWLSFYAYRKFFIEPDKFGYQIAFEADENLYLGVLAIPACWLMLYFLSGIYQDVWRKSRIKELSLTFSTSLLGVVVLFFGLLLDDEVKSYQVYYQTFLILFGLHFLLTATVRLLLATYIKKLINAQKIGFNTLIVGNNSMAIKLVNEIENEFKKERQGYLFKGFVNAPGEVVEPLQNTHPYFGSYTNLSQIVDEYKIEEVIVVLETTKHQLISEITNLLEDKPVILKIVPDVFDVLSGQVKMKNVLGTALIEINHQTMPMWQKALKRVFDIFVSLALLLLLSPAYVVLAFAVKISSTGPVFFKQERVGIHGKPFKIIKYRTMFVDAEVTGPALSSKNDKRITALGKVLRKYRLDEIPQFYNVLVGEMSLVGPRPERQFYIDQIMKHAPHYKHLQRVKPGITSWGMVKYGYAENIEQMIERLNFDIIYIENRSLAMDFRIMIYTIKTILQGRGK